MEVKNMLTKDLRENKKVVKEENIRDYEPKIMDKSSRENWDYNNYFKDIINTSLQLLFTTDKEFGKDSKKDVEKALDYIIDYLKKEEFTDVDIDDIMDEDEMIGVIKWYYKRMAKRYGNLRESRTRRKKIMKEKVFNIEVEAPTFEEIYIVENEYRWNWDEANEHARNHHFGYSYWRLPTVEELKWIAKNVEINSDKEGWYWSSETCRYGEEDAYIVFLTAYGNGGDVEGYYKKYDDINTLYVRGIDSETRDYLKLEKHIKKTTKESKKELNEGFKSYLTNLSDAFKEYVSETSSKGMFTLKTLKDYLLSTFDSYKKYDKNDLTEIAKNFIDEWLEKKLIGDVGYDSYAFRDLKYESKTLKESELEFDLFDEFKKSAPKDFVIDDFIKFLKNFDETYKKYSTEKLRDFAKDFIETWKDADLIDEIDKEKYRIKTIVEQKTDTLKESENDEIIVVADEMKKKYPELKNVSMIQKYPSNDLTYKQALKYAEELKLAGYTDWRLPTFREAKQIAKTFGKEMKLNFAYWTSTRYLNSDPYVVNHRGDNDSTDHELSFYECFCVR
jgi:hypothetical protein